MAVHYEDFTVVLGPPQDGEYPVIIERSPAGQARGTFRVPFSDGELRELQQRLGRFVRSSSRIRAEGDGAEPPPAGRTQVDPKDVGGRLFRALFSGEVGLCLERSLAAVEGRSGLRLRLHLPAGRDGFASLVSLPWEVLYWAERGQFPGLLRSISLVRLHEIARCPHDAPVELPLRVLAVASGAGNPPLNVEEEYRSLEAACAGIAHVEITRLPKATPHALRQALHERDFHVLHFMGHGAYNRTTGAGVLVFEKEDGSPNLLPASSFADLVHDFPSLRLVLLTACDSARMPSEDGLDAFASVASALLRAGLPAVVAMQYRISGEAADLFSEAFYRRLVAGDPVDAATAEGRMAIHLEDAGSVEWATPVLFLRTPDGRLFESKPEIPPGIRQQITNFSQLIAEKTEGFVGRRWLFDSIDRFTRDKPHGYFVLRGDPGIGKSALIARMVKDGGHVHHFNVRAEGIRKPEMFLQNVCAQLVAKYGLGLSSLPMEAMQDTRFLTSLLERVAAKLRPDQKALLLVDALDESDKTALTPGANVLYLPKFLPSGIYFVVTTRRGEPALNVDCALEVLDLQQDHEGNMADVRELVASKLPLPGIRTYIVAQGLDDEAFVAEMVVKSQGNFMYLRHVLPEIERGAYQDLEFDALPIGLHNYYEDHWRRMRSRDKDAWRDLQIPVLTALAVIEEPTPLPLIAKFTGVDPRKVREVLTNWEEFLYVDKIAIDPASDRLIRRYRLYHASFQEFIAAKDEVEDEVSLQASHLRVADTLRHAP